MSQGNQLASGSLPAANVSSEVVVAAVIFVFVAIAFFFFVYLYTKHFRSSNTGLEIYGPSSVSIGPIPSHGLADSTLKSLPITIFRSTDVKESLECAVCLTDLSDGEEARLLPKCGHGFHVKCIDMWFHSNSTCPLCRRPVVGPDPPQADSSEMVESSHVLPTNTLFWGDRSSFSSGGNSTTPTTSQTGGSSSEDMLVIEIPRRVTGEFPSQISPLQSSRLPGSTRLRSLTRLLSWGRTTTTTTTTTMEGSSGSPRGGDIEEGSGGGGGARPPNPKTPVSY